MGKRYEIQRLATGAWNRDGSPIIEATVARNNSLVHLCRYGFKKNMFRSGTSRVYDNRSGASITSWTAVNIADGCDIESLVEFGDIPEDML